jgi:hypothetical protein
LAAGIETLGSEQHHGRTPAAGCGQVSVEVVIQRHANPRIIPCELQNLNVLRPMHPYLGDMHGGEPLLASDARRIGGKPLIEENSLHATRTTLSRSSSTVAAA